MSNARLRWAVLVGALGLVASTLSLNAADGAPATLRIEALSNRADLVSGGDVLLRIHSSAGTNARGVTIASNGRLKSALHSDPSGKGVLAYVVGLREGKNTITARVGGATAALDVTNHPIGGPIFSGPQVQPWVCTTAENGLGTPMDAQCNVVTSYDYQYWSTEEGGFQPYDPASPPSDIAQTKTDQGVKVPYIVRREFGALNRGLYGIAVLFDPAKTWTPWAPQKAWNHKLFYPFGASCNTNYTQGNTDSFNVLVDKALSKGFAVATSSLNTLGQNCNTITSAETVMMVKERVVEQYGEIRYTFGEGGSGGSIGQLVVANAYPGLLNGLLPSQTFPDTWTTAYEVADCHLLLHYFSTTSPHMWTDTAQQTAVNGHEGVSSCAAWEGLFAPAGDPTHGCGLANISPLPSASVPVMAIRTPDDYHPVLNPNGCRGTVQDMQVGVWGRRPQDGFAKAVFDNVGVQYGLKALQAGTISASQFVDLNEKVGGLDIDFNRVSHRNLADPGTPLIGHRVGQANDARGLSMVGIIDMPPTSNVEIHTPYHAFGLSERMRKAYGNADNHVIWRGGPGALAFATMDKWLSAVEADGSSLSMPRKIVANRPRIAVNSCFIDNKQVLSKAQCDETYPYYGDARIAAGSPLSSDVLKCSLKPHRRSAYKVELTDDQWTRLERIFSNGVCNWSKPGVGQVRSVPWMTFAGGPGGRPLGAPPQSRLR